MRLIDADELIEESPQIFVEKFGIEGGEMFKGVIKQMPTAYDVDKVIKEIESCFNATEGKGRRLAYHRAITIVKGGINGLD